MTSGVSGFSSCLIWNYRKVLEILSLSGPAQARDTVELTSHDSPNEFREYVAGVIAGGEISLDGNFIKGDAAGQIAFHTDVQGGTKRNGFIVMPMAVGGSLFFAAIARGFEPSYPFDSKIGVTGSLIVTGKPLLLTVQATGLTTPFLSGIHVGGVEDGNALTILPETKAADVYAYTCTIAADTTGVKLTATCAGQTPYIQGIEEASGVQTDAAITCAVGVTDILILCYTTADPPGTSPRLYILSVTRPE